MSIAANTRFPFPSETLVSTNSMEELGRKLSRVTEERRFRMLGTDPWGRFEIKRLELPTMQIFGCDYRGAVRSSSEPLPCFEFYFIGRGRLVTGRSGAVVNVGPGEGVVHFPGERSVNRWRSGSKYVVIRVDRDAMPHSFGGICGTDIPGLNLSMQKFSMSRGIGRSLLQILGQLCDEDRQNEPSQEQALLEDLLRYGMSLMIESRLARDGIHHTRRLNPGYLNRVVEFILSNLDQEITADQLREVAGVTNRALQYSFVKQFGKGPMTFVKHARLTRVREELQRSVPGERNVTDIAADWGFFNASTFSRNYRRLFGECPSDTLGN